MCHGLRFIAYYCRKSHLLFERHRHAFRAPGEIDMEIKDARNERKNEKHALDKRQLLQRIGASKDYRNDCADYERRPAKVCGKYASNNSEGHAETKICVRK